MEEDECIATFSSDDDDDNANRNKRYEQLPLSQKITKVYQAMNDGQVIEINKQILHN